MVIWKGQMFWYQKGINQPILYLKLVTLVLGNGHVAITVKITTMSSWHTINTSKLKPRTIVFEGSEVFLEDVKTSKSDIYPLVILICHIFLSYP